MTSTSGRVAAVRPGLLLLVLGMVLVVGPSITGGNIPGDLGDARSNSYLLEHFHRWITGRDPSFWNPGFYFPFPLTLAFSDNFLGDGVFYSCFRLAGFDREDAFNLWFAVGYVLNFAAAAYALRRLEYSRAGAAIGAFLFAFALPVTAQENHAQLIYRFGVPLAALYLIRYVLTGAPKYLSWSAFWLTWQFFCSIYLGYFLALMLGALSFALVADELAMRKLPLRLKVLCARPLRGWSEVSPSGRTGVLLVLSILAGLLALLVAPYLEVSRLYGFSREWGETGLMLPRWQSYLLATNSRIWPSTGPLFSVLPPSHKHEHALFLGLAAWLAIGVAGVLRFTRRSAADPLFWPAVLTILILACVTLSVNGHSLYQLLWAIPGPNAIRAVSRVILVLLFAFSVLVASSADAILTARLPARAGAIAAVLICILMVGESAFIGHLTDTKAHWRERLVTLAAQLPPATPKSPILLVAPKAGEPDYAREIDGMIFAQDHGWPTINGYSGNEPPTHVMTGTCRDAPTDLAAGLAFLGGDAPKGLGALERRMVLVGYPDCAASPRPGQLG